MRSNEDASVGVITYFFLLLMFFALFYLMFGGIIDEFVAKANDQLADPAMHTSQQKQDLLGQLVNAWWVLPLIVVFAGGYFAIKNAIRERSGDVF